MTSHTDPPKRRIAFVSTRIAGTDGVSLEIEKWADVLTAMGHECFYVAGECDRPEDRRFVVEEMHFKHPEISKINRLSFGRELRSSKLGTRIHQMMFTIKDRLKSALDYFDIDLIIAENCLTIPMNLPLGLALVETVMETGLGCIAHHHDFVWERERFLVNAVEDYLRAAFPPSLPQMNHVVINSIAARDFSRRCGLPCRVIPNVMDFDRPPARPDEPNRAFRKAIGLAEEDILILQPTRLIARKGIEHAVELVSHLDDPRCKLVVTHASGDEGDVYAERIRRYARALKVPVIFAHESMATRRAAADGRTRFTIADAYQAADFVTYPSSYEGFGNAFLEAIYYRCPLLCNRYAIYRTDIEPCGFDVVLMDGFLTDEVVEQVREVLTNSERKQRMVEQNYEVGLRFFSYHRVESELQALLAKPRLAPPPPEE
ncbi:MAG: glycosyltransferase [Planctomycetaceae bacterium]